MDRIVRQEIINIFDKRMKVDQLWRALILYEGSRIQQSRVDTCSSFVSQKEEFKEYRISDESKLK